jgi:hypothetical protein
LTNYCGRKTIPNDQDLYNLAHKKYTYDDGRLISKHTGKPIASMGTGYLKCEFQISGKVLRMRVHRVIFLMHHGYMPGVVDHINGDTLDNRIENLRAATHQQNSVNRKVSSRNKLGIKGVVFDNRLRQYVVYMKVNGRSKRIGGYKTPEAAAEAYEAMAEKIHGEFAQHLHSKTIPSNDCSNPLSVLSLQKSNRGTYRDEKRAPHFVRSSIL